MSINETKSKNVLGLNNINEETLKRVREGDLVRVKPKGHNKWLDGKVKKLSNTESHTGRVLIENLIITYPCNCYRTARYQSLPPHPPPPKH